MKHLKLFFKEGWPGFGLFVCVCIAVWRGDFFAAVGWFVATVAFAVAILVSKAALEWRAWEENARRWKNLYYNAVGRQEPLAPGEKYESLKLKSGEKPQ